MSDDEREAWGDRLIAATIEDDSAVAAILDRVVALERELADARVAPRHCGRIMRIGDHKRCLGCGDVWPIDSPVAS